MYFTHLLLLYELNYLFVLFINIIKHTSLIQLQYIEHSTVNWQDIINVIDKI
jgi:hypothetical protein